MKLTIKVILSVLVACFLSRSSAQGNTGPEPVLKTASDNLMQYYISLPPNWNKNKQWPVLFVVEAAEKQFKQNAERFRTAGKNTPFIIISPIIVTNGNYGRRDPSVYPYTSETWDKIDAMTDCVFDMEGIIRIADDVKKSFNGDSKVYITGFEAGAHLVWAMLLEHPDLLLAASPVAGNYNGRCIDGTPIPSGAADVVVKVFSGQLDKECRPGGRLYAQVENAKRQAAAKGIKNISEIVVPGREHMPLPDEVIAYFLSLLR